MNWKYVIFTLISCITLLPLVKRIFDRNKELQSARGTESHLTLPYIPSILISIPPNGGEKLLQTIGSIDFPIETLILHDNSHGDESVGCVLQSLETFVGNRKFEQIKNLVVLKSKTKYSKSLGASLNQLLEFAFLSMQLPWVIITQVGVTPQPESLSSIATTAWKEHYSMTTNFFPNLSGRALRENGFDLFVVTRAGWGRVGLFDENFWPVPMDWCDYEARLLAWNEHWKEISNAHVTREDSEQYLGNVEFKHCFVNGSTLSTPEAKAMENSDKRHTLEAISNEYFFKKWGRYCDESGGFQEPFNSIRYVLGYWVLDNERMNKIKSIVDE